MVWTEITRRQYRRKGLRYESDTTDAEWLVMESLLPPASALGRPRATDMRTVIDAILYIASTGCQWRQLTLPTKVTFKVFAHLGGNAFIWYGIIPSYLATVENVFPHVFYSPSDYAEKQNKE